MKRATATPRRARRSNRRGDCARPTCAHGRKRRSPGAARRCRGPREERSTVRHLLVQHADLRQPAGEHDDIGVEQVDDRRESARRAVDEACPRGQRGLVSRFRGRDDVRRRQRLSRDASMICGNGWSRDPALDAALLAAVTGRPRQLVGLRPGQRIMPPLAGNEVGARQSTSSYDDATAHAGPPDDPENHVGAGSGAITRFGQGEAVGIVVEPDLALQGGREVGAKRLTDQPNGIRVLDQPRIRSHGARNADADRPSLSGGRFECRHQRRDGRDRRIIRARRRDAPPPEFASHRVESDAFDLGPTEVNPDLHGGNCRR
jgi:hypothetical protein